MADSPIHSKIDLPTYEILIGGKELNEAYEVISIQVEREINKVSGATIIISDGEAHKGEFEISELADFDLGKEVEIKLGYHSTNESVFKGVIAAHEIKIRAYSNRIVSYLELDCRDKAYKMTVSRKTSCALKKKDSDIIKSIIGDYSLTAKSEATTFEHPWIIQHDCTDWDFINLRAQANGLMIFNVDGQVEAKKPEVSGTAVLKVSHEIVETFKAEVDSSKQFKKISFSAWDPAKQELVDGESVEPTLNNFGTDKGAAVSKAAGDNEMEYKFSTKEDAATLKSLASGLLLSNRLSMFKGNLKFVGSAKVELGCLITLEGFGKRFNGDIFITGFTHTLEDGYWSTTCRFGLPTISYEEMLSYQTQAKSTTGFPDIDGLHLGKVKKVDEDPDGEFRVQVAINTLDGTTSPIWARLLMPYTTSEAGFFFFPEVDSEVLVGFLNNDPRNALILGSLYSSKSKAPFEAPKAENKDKGIVTKEKLKITFDDTDKIIVVETPGGQKITLDDKEKSLTLEDQTENKIQMSESGIIIDSPKDIKMTSKAKISISGDGGVSIESKGNIDQKGAQISIKGDTKVALQAPQVEGKADAKLSMKGAQAEFAGDAMAMIKGGIVKIN